MLILLDKPEMSSGRLCTVEWPVGGGTAETQHAEVFD